MSVEELLAITVAELPNLKSNESFLVKDLFKGYIWSRIPKADREALGEAFSSRVDAEFDAIIMKLDRTSSNQQKYRRR